MRNCIRIILCVMLFLTFSGCRIIKHDPYIHNGYTQSQEHRQKERFQDITDFCVYHYDSDKSFRNDPNYTEMKAEDVESIRGFFSNFKQWMEAQHRLDEYTFDEACISEGDYFLIKTKEGERVSDFVYGQYDSYTLYFFDRESFSLFYIHTNI